MRRLNCSRPEPKGGSQHPAHTWKVVVVNIRRQTYTFQTFFFFFSFLTEEVDILLTVTGRGEGWYLPHKRDSDREMMGSTYLHVQVVVVIFKILRSYKRSIKQVTPPPFYYSPVYSPTAVMDVQILGGEDSGLSITTSWSRRCNNLAVREGVGARSVSDAVLSVFSVSL